MSGRRLLSSRLFSATSSSLPAPPSALPAPSVTHGKLDPRVMMKQPCPPRLLPLPFTIQRRRVSATVRSRLPEIAEFRLEQETRRRGDWKKGKGRIQRVDVRVQGSTLDVAKRKSTLGPLPATFWLLLQQNWLLPKSHTALRSDRQRGCRIWTGGGHEFRRVDWMLLGISRPGPRPGVAHVFVGHHQASKTWNLRF